ncbi:hypothetical protein G7Z17_g4690 [Cylindrodendrum hubeiense]|uniref:Uncharacterized protein n=1 Tax=Cylindrodendrum hubeiense TaxID=595255 RepID=A0A9P5HIK6_9HYPO|nr:hypothetical protein G7Z17_g4690 [Cylindrodendrum hubeiense]
MTTWLASPTPRTRVLSPPATPPPPNEPVYDPAVTSAAEPQLPAPEHSTLETTPAPPATNTPPPDLKLTGWRSIVDGWLTLFAIVFPWACGMIISWMPLTKISLNDARGSSLIMVSIIASTIEVSSIFLWGFGVMVQACIDPAYEYSNGVISVIWMIFIMVDPIVTGGYVWSTVDSDPCKDDPDPDSAQCRVGDTLIRGIGVFRVFVVFTIFCLSLQLCDCLRKKFKAQQWREQQQRQNSGV